MPVVRKRQVLRKKKKVVPLMQLRKGNIFRRENFIYIKMCVIISEMVYCKWNKHFRTWRYSKIRQHQGVIVSSYQDLSTSSLIDFFL